MCAKGKALRHYQTTKMAAGGFILQPWPGKWHAGKLMLLIMVILPWQPKAIDIPASLSDAVVDACMNIKAKSLDLEASEEWQPLTKACRPIFSFLEAKQQLVSVALK
jgi:hypothetical protein